MQPRPPQHSPQPAPSHSLPRYRRCSLPVPAAHRQSAQQPNSDIYFNQHKKSRFMKSIVDNYFGDALSKIQGNEAEARDREQRTLHRSIRNSVRRSRNFFASVGEVDARGPQLRKSSKSYTKQKQHQEQVNQLYLSVSSSGNFTSLLPPIYQEQTDELTLTKSISELPESTEASLTEEPSSKILTFENEAFRIYVAHIGNTPKYRIKQYKTAGLQILRRQQRALKYGVQALWQQSQLNANTYVSPIVHPLKNLICKLTPNHDSSHIKWKIRSTTYRRHLLANDCQQLRIFIREMCRILKRIEGRVLNNKVNPGNIFVTRGGKPMLGEWGCSSFREQYQIQNKGFESRVSPILKSSKQWLATPEYLSPELLHALMARTQDQQPDIWQYRQSSDVWSLGMTLFEIVTMVPVWMNAICHCKTKTKRPVVRAGLLGTDDRDVAKIAQKQNKIEVSIRACLWTQLEQSVSEQILVLIERMLAYDPARRVTLDQILTVIK